MELGRCVISKCVVSVDQTSWIIKAWGGTTYSLTWARILFTLLHALSFYFQKHRKHWNGVGASCGVLVTCCYCFEMLNALSCPVPILHLCTQLQYKVFFLQHFTFNSRAVYVTIVYHINNSNNPSKSHILYKIYKNSFMALSPFHFIRTPLKGFFSSDQFCL